MAIRSGPAFAIGATSPERLLKWNDNTEGSKGASWRCLILKVPMLAATRPEKISPNSSSLSIMIVSGELLATVALTSVAAAPYIFDFCAIRVVETGPGETGRRHEGTIDDLELLSCCRQTAEQRNK
jgi:hypothetical protein